MGDGCRALAVCAIACAWLGCADDAPSTAAGNATGMQAAGAGGGAGFGAGASAPQAGTGGGGTGGNAGTSAPGARPDAAVQSPSDAGAMPDAGAPPARDAATDPGEQWTLLMEERWTLPAGGEVPQWCADLMLNEDVFVTAIRPIHPLGTHHTTLSVTETATACSTAAVLQNGIIYAAGVGSEELRMPPGVAMKLPAGRVLRLGLHLYNVGDQPLEGVSGVEVVRVDAEDVEHEAELMLAGPVRLMIEPGRQTITHTCNVTEPQTVFAIFPHMHQLGVHMKTTLMTGGQARVVHDGEYRFEEQYQIPLSPVELAVGDRIVTECTFENATGQVVGFGESSDTEMCFSIFFRYPATGNSFCGRAAP